MFLVASSASVSGATALNDAQDWLAVRAVRSFADELDAIASAHFCPSLRDYTATLKHEVATFQISRIEKSLAEFPTLVETLAPLSPSSPS